MKENEIGITGSVEHGAPPTDLPSDLVELRKEFPGESAASDQRTFVRQVESLVNGNEKKYQMLTMRLNQAGESLSGIGNLIGDEDVLTAWNAYLEAGDEEADTALDAMLVALR